MPGLTLIEHVMNDIANGKGFVYFTYSRSMEVDVLRLLSKYEKLMSKNLMILASGTKLQSFASKFIQPLSNIGKSKTNVYLVNNLQKIITIHDLPNSLVIVACGKDDEIEDVKYMEKLIESEQSAELPWNKPSIKAILVTDLPFKSDRGVFSWNDNWNDFIHVSSLEADKPIEHDMESIIKGIEELKVLVDSLSKNTR